jgi:hypothetical protein
MKTQKKEHTTSPYARFFCDLEGFDFYRNGKRIYRYQLWLSGRTDAFRLLTGGYEGITYEIRPKYEM